MNREEFVLRVSGERKRLLQIARGMIRSCDCEDAVQSAILSAWEHQAELRDEKAFDAWLKRILINRCRQIQRGYKKEKEACAAAFNQNREKAVGESDLYEALGELGGEEERLIRLHHEKGYTLKEISAMTGKSEDIVKMRLYRARNHLRAILISLLLLGMLASAAIGTDLLDVNWFLKNRRAEPPAIEQRSTRESAEIEYSGELLGVSVSDAVWNHESLSLTLVYSIAGKGDDAVVVHGGKIGVDGVRFDHIWTAEGIVPIREWAQGSAVEIFRVEEWRLHGMNLLVSQDYIPDGKGETFMAALTLDRVEPDAYEEMLDENGRLAFSAALVLEDYRSGIVLEEGTAVISVQAPAAEEWRRLYEAYHR